MDISYRLYRLLKSVTNEKVDQFVDLLGRSGSVLDDVLKEWEIKHGLDQDSTSAEEAEQETGYRENAGAYSSHKQDEQTQQDRFRYAGYPQQVIEDLHLFGLSPPVTLEELRKTRNREIKKFHPDRFMNDPEKMETAKRILQIYNAAYERLKTHLK